MTDAAFPGVFAVSRVSWTGTGQGGASNIGPRPAGQGMPNRIPVHVEPFGESSVCPTFTKQQPHLLNGRLTQFGTAVD